MILGAVMDEIADTLDTIEGLRVKGYDADEIQVPAAIVSLPTLLNYQRAYERGTDSLTLMVIVLVAATSDRKRRDMITPYADGKGPKSIKEVLERGNYNACSSVTVQNGAFRFYTYNSIKYLGIAFTVAVIGEG